MAAVREKTLQAHFAGATTPAQLRPIMTSLNGDNSWLLSFPRPEAERRASGKAYYHIVFEPWLNGSTSMVSSWIVHVRHEKTPAVTDAEGVRAVVGQIEAVADGALATKATESRGRDGAEQGTNKPNIDAIVLGFHYLDHLHEPTLRLFDPSTPVIATPEAVAILKPWNHFTTIRTISNFEASAKSWKSPGLHPGEPLPPWLTIVRLPGGHELNYITAIIWTHLDAASGNEVHEAVLQTPHGTRLDVGPLEAFLNSEPPTQKLALLHGLKESRLLGHMNTYGAKGGLALYRKIGGAQYWMLTHDSRLKYSGIMMRLLCVYDTPRTLQWGLDEEVRKSSKNSESRLETPNCVAVQNGGCFVLE